MSTAPIPEVESKNRLLHFLGQNLRFLKLAVIKTLTVMDLTIPERSTTVGVVSPVDFEQVGGLVIGETYINPPSTPATATVTIFGAPDDIPLDDFIEITDTAGTSIEYTAKDAESAAAAEFDRSLATPTLIATSLKNCIEAAGHAATITVTQAGPELTLTQVAEGAAGNITITKGPAGGPTDVVVTGFAGGVTELSSWTLSAPPTNAQGWHPSANNDFYGLAGVTFVVPASGRVEIQVRCSLDSTTGAERIYLRLCTAVDGTSLGTRYQKVVLRTRPNNTSEYTLLQTWTLVGLTPGTSTTYYLGAAAASGTHYLKAGGACTGDTDVTTDAWPQFAMRAIAVASNANTI